MFYLLFYRYIEMATLGKNMCNHADSFVYHSGVVKINCCGQGYLSFVAPLVS